MRQGTFHIGQEVFISDLILSPHYNNLMAVVTSGLSKRKRRYAVRIMYSEKLLTMKPQNLSHPNDLMRIESMFRFLAINERSKFVVNCSKELIASIINEYGSSSLPPFGKFFDSSLGGYHENCDSVYCVLLYMSLFSSISGHRRKFDLSSWGQPAEAYSAVNTLRTFAADTVKHKLSVLFLAFSTHKMCVLRYQQQFRVVQSVSSLCRYPLIEELNRRNWLNEREINNFIDALSDVLYGKSVNLSEWIFGKESVYRADDGDISVVVLGDLNVEMFVKVGRQMLTHIIKELEDNSISINVCA